MSRCGSCKLYDNGCEGNMCIEACAYTLQDYICDIMARAEAAEARVHELETTHRTEMCSDGYDCVQLRKARKAVADAEARAEKAEKERDAAIQQLHGYCPACKNYTPNHCEGPCARCKHEYYQYRDTDSLDNWEWKGPKEE